MSAGGATPAGSSRGLRLDPFSLPVRFRSPDAAADERTRLVELSRESVVLRRSVRGVRIKVSLPVSAFRGIAMRLVPPDGTDAGAIAVTLEHHDPALSVPLFAAADANDVLAEWHMWARIFGLPLLVADGDGELREPFRRLGAVQVADPCPRMRRRGPVRQRRPRILMRRKAGRPAATPAIHCERELIARD
jgi:uncharacterized protein DUF6101